MLLYSRMGVCETMNKSELIDEVFNQTVMPKKDCVRAVDAVFGIILAELEKGNSVKIANFGTFEIKRVPERKITDLRSGEVVSVPAQETVRFRPARKIKAKVNARSSGR